MGIRYHEKKGSALEVAAELEKNPLIRATSVQLEPYNGWVVVVVPEFVDVEEIAAGCEIRDHKVRKNLDKKKPPAPAISPRPVSGSRSSSGPNQRAAEEHRGFVFSLKGRNYRKEGTAGWLALEWLKANPLSTSDEIASAGPFMQHVAYDFKKGNGIERKKKE